MPAAVCDSSGPAAAAYGFPGPPKWSGVAAALSRALGTVPPPLLLILAIVSIQMGSVLAIQLFPILGPTGTVFLRILLGAVLLVVATRPAFDRTLGRHLGLILVFGLSIAAMNFCFFQAIARVPLGIAVTIEFLGPLAVAVVATHRAVDFVWVALAVFGIALLTPEFGAALDPLGLMFAGLAACAWASFILLSVRVGRIFPGTSGLSLAMIAAAIYLLPLGVTSTGAIAVAPIVLLGALAVALLSTAVPLALEYESLKRMPPRTYGIVITVEPAVAMIIGALLLGDAIGLRGVIAVVAVMAAALGATLFGRRGS